MEDDMKLLLVVLRDLTESIDKLSDELHDCSDELSDVHFALEDLR